MAKYIKANPLVAKYLGLEGDRNTVSDGNYLLWQGDMLAFGKLAELYDIAARIGALVLEPYEARQEQDGTTIRPLPIATDTRFVTAEQEAVTEEDESKQEDDTDNSKSATDSTTDNKTADTAEKGEQL